MKPSGGKDSMETFLGILDYISRTNLFNFVIFLTIIILLCKKIKVVEKIERMKTSVSDSIEESKTVKLDSESRLSSVEEGFSHLGEEIESILKKSEENANRVGEKILDDAEKSALVIRENTGKALENSRMLLKNELIRRASIASIEVAKSKILNELINNPELHDRLIDESINSIEGVQL